MTSLRRQAGLSLIELMIASVVALVMLAGVGQLFLSTRQMNIADEASSDVQDTARYVLHFITEQVRQAGMMGCAKLGANNYTSSISAYDGDYAHPFNVGIQGYQKGTSTLPSVLDSLPIVAGSDILVVRRADEQSFRMSEPQDSSSFHVEFQSSQSKSCKGNTLPKINGICQDDILVAADCQKARSFVVSSISTRDAGGTTIVDIDHITNNTPSSWGGSASDNPLDKFDERDTTLSKAATTAYYIDSNGNFNKKVNTDSAETIVSGIEYMRILYGIDSDDDGTVNRYVDASTLSPNPQLADNFNRVISLQIALLVRSQQPVQNANEISSGSSNYDLLGTTVTKAADGYIHKVFQATVFLRNGGMS